ncbi:probable ribosomal RNA small subunit methyltransferase B isoform X1 [Zingiber officinale]|uniref:probable ribosomal RNA small subunit methyltransferase B isoform X1 n=1 Tax=Zingiber officinale TaxID=94328 RepID=UPI001C4BB878|nr:probable ribosomal RNA small subunit methyltransferase B isoform X1 [Zingiber officinale]
MEGASVSPLCSHFLSSALSKTPCPQKAHPPFSGPFHGSIPIARISTYFPVGSPGPRKKNTDNTVNTEISPHRAVSAVRLLRIDQGGAFADLLNEKGRNSAKNEMGYVERTLGFRTRDLDDRDIRLVTEIVGGTVRWRRYLDHLIMSLCKEEGMFRSMEPLLLQVLRIGFYEIIKLEMPPYAVVDENVKLAKRALRPGAGNLVNGILRKLLSLKDTDSLPLPKVVGDDRSQARALAIIHSHPVWMVRRWINLWGVEESVKLMNWNNSNPYFGLRVNTAKGYTRIDLANQLKSLKVPFELSTYLKDFVRLQTGMQTVIQSGLLKEGICSVQDESAGLVVSVVDPQPGDTIIDCCAAPGGKTLFMASRLRGQGMILAIDINKGRLRILKETSRLHNVHDVVTTTNADLRLYAEMHNIQFDKVLLDVPCSGLGVLSKRADLRWNRRFEDFEQLKNLQDELLNAASMLVKPGGVLVYSTCSIDHHENEGRVAAFLLRHPEFAVNSVDGYVPPEFVSEEGYYFSNPVKHCIDGSFATRLVKSSSYTS